ncbi:MAG: alpha/beta fold hydrolase [Planctomycetota bacterium]|nr:alpha/beta fold hydrolase [Planctomycetota bacterium]
MFGQPKSGFPTTERRILTLSDGDAIVLHDDCPRSWQAGQRCALFVHGLGGDHQSTIVSRMAWKLFAQGIRTFRIDLRLCGAALLTCRWPNHAGRAKDVQEAAQFIEQLCPESAISVIGISMGGNITLQLLSMLSETGYGAVDSGVAICPPIDIQQTVDRRNWGNYFYEQYFLNLLYNRFLKTREKLHHGPKITFKRRPSTVREHDENFTVPLCEFDSANHYYESASSCYGLPKIAVPTLIIAARDDPLVPPEPLENAILSSATELVMTEKGGHLGFISRLGVDDDTRWVEWRIIEWLKSRGLVREDEESQSLNRNEQS